MLAAAFWSGVLGGFLVSFLITGAAALWGINNYKKDFGKLDFDKVKLDVDERKPS